MKDQGFIEFQTPILTASSPEGARDYLVPSRLHPGKFYALPQAPQQFKQLIMVAGFDRYFQIAPCFRDEDARADRSPGEFYQLDLEMSFVTQQDVFDAVEPVIRGVFEEFGNGKTVTPKFPLIPYAEAMTSYGTDKPDLRSLIKQDRFDLCWIVDFPMFEWNEEDKKIDFSHNPFSMPNMDVDEFLKLDAGDQDKILGMKAIQYDIVCNGVELSSGAIRNHRPDVMRKAFAIAGYGENTLEQKFGGMLRALSLGAPPHGGIAPGLDRIVMLLCGEENLREVVLFPMNQKAEDLMMGAPSEVTPKQLRELHIRLNLPDRPGSS